MSGFGDIKGIKKEKDDDEEVNEYYAGGNDDRGGGSGQAVLAPKKKKKEGTGEALYSRLIENAKKDAKERPIEEGESSVEITLYSNGFVVDNGPFRGSGVPANDAFLQQMANGDCPPELMKDGQVPAIKLNNKEKEKYTPPAYTAFSGAGNTIGGSKLATSVEDVIQMEGDAEKPVVNEGEKTVRVQIKYPDAKRQVVKFNLHHVVNDLIAVIRDSGKIQVPFVLQDMKRKVVPGSLFSSTITEAGLANSVVLVVTKI